MNKEEIVNLLRLETLPIYQIEKNLGMPTTTLQKALSGERELPKKWGIKLKLAYATKKQSK